jgi:lysophospholipase L1-like esterase
MSITLKLLASHRGHKPGTIITVDDDTGAQLLKGNATTDLTGGTPYTAPVAANQKVPALVEVNPAGVVVGLTTQNGVTVPLPGRLIVSGSSAVGGTVTANYSDGGAGTFQFTRTPRGGGAAVAFGSAVAVGTSYTVQASDRGYNIGAQPVTYTPPGGVGMDVPITQPAAPTTPTVVAGNKSITATFSRNADNGGDPVTADRVYVYRASDDALVAQANGTSPLTLTGIAGGVAVYCKAASMNGAGVGPKSAASATVTPTGGVAQGPVAPTPTLRQVATGTHVYNILAAGGTNVTTFSRTPHVLKSAVSALSLVLPGWYVNGQTETAAASASWTASIEYPANTFVQVTFGGSATGTIANGGNLVSDMMPVSIPKGAKFWVRLFQNAPSKAIYFNYYAGDGTAYFTSPATDLTMSAAALSSGSLSPATFASITTPLAILGMSTDPAIGVFGDSIAVGRGDTADAGVPLQGHLGRAFGANYAVGNMGVSGDNISSFLAGNAKRMSLAQYFTHFAVNMGTNDITGGATAGTVATNTNALVALFGGKPVALCTISPRSTSTDSWATTANQAVLASESVRVTENTRRLAGIAGVKAIYDVNPAVESVASPESGLWKAPSYTADGVHPAVTAYKAEAAAINPALLLA